MLKIVQAAVAAVSLIGGLVHPHIVFAADSDETKIVSWNLQLALYEALPEKLKGITEFSKAEQPDVVVFQEIAGDYEARQIADALGWSSYHAIVSDFTVLRTNGYFALEVLVVSKIPIVSVVEYDAKVDGHREVFTEMGIVAGLVSEEVLSSEGIKGFAENVAETDRGTLRVDLENGLSLFSAHLKSNRIRQCSDMGTAASAFKRAKEPIPAYIENVLANGSATITKDRLTNAAKRERVLAATILAASAISNDRIPVILGDYNTGFVTGVKGASFDDCTLEDFGCAKGKFPATMCSDGDGYDDTLALLEEGLATGEKWTVLSRDLKSTYVDKVFDDAAIDHISVPSRFSKYFSTATKTDEFYGSDHNPVFTIFTAP